jgi:hypothetical protein
MPEVVRSVLLLVVLVACAALAAGCGCTACDVPPEGGGGPPLAARAADFALVDANPASPTGSQTRSVRQQLSTVSAWYFGHAT